MKDAEGRQLNAVAETRATFCILFDAFSPQSMIFRLYNFPYSFILSYITLQYEGSINLPTNMFTITI